MITALCISLIIAGALIVFLVLWILSAQQKIVILEENIDDIMNQTGVQLSSQFDALIALMSLAGSYAKRESERMTELIKTQRKTITEESVPADVFHQEKTISIALSWLSLVSEQYPEFKVDENYEEMMGAVKRFGSMVNTSRLMYNDSVTRFNRALRKFPVSMVAGMLDLSKKEYLEEKER